jgi:Mn-dependent DtxR family transcriptional regulator
MSENAEAVLKAMEEIGKPMRPGEVAKKMGIESKAVSKAIQALKKEGKVHSPKRCYWAPT